MKTYTPIVAAAFCAAFSACCSPTTSPAPAASVTTYEAPAVEPLPGAKTTCAEGEFAACPTGKHCARRRTEFVNPVSCYAHAADACDAASCVFGCDVYNTELGGPKMVLCAPNASSTGHMKVCGGFAGWACPENMTCEFAPEAARTNDASGKCVPKIL